jgi:hypothetical protein
MNPHKFVLTRSPGRSRPSSPACLRHCCLSAVAAGARADTSGAPSNVDEKRARGIATNGEETATACGTSAKSRRPLWSVIDERTLGVLLLYARDVSLLCTDLHEICHERRHGVDASMRCLPCLILIRGSHVLYALHTSCILRTSPISNFSLVSGFPQICCRSSSGNVSRYTW